MKDHRVLQNFQGASVDEIEDRLESNDVVFFERCPIELPTEADLALLREELPRQSKLKNVSYHPESGSIPRFEAPEAIKERATNILRGHSRIVEAFLEAVIPDLTPNWTVGTCSFRPLEEKGRGLKPRSSNEIVHIDAGAYGATGGNRLLRFFVNVNPSVDRIWGTKGSFATLFEQYEGLSAAARGKRDKIRVRKRILDHCFSGVIGGLSKLYPLLKVIDSSPYDRAMRRIHNYMKESQAFRNDPSNYREIRFPPFSTWMVFTDGVSHSVVSGQHALVTTILIPLKNCRRPDLSPYNIMQGAT